MRLALGLSTVGLLLLAAPVVALAGEEVTDSADDPSVTPERIAAFTQEMPRFLGIVLQ